MDINICTWNGLHICLWSISEERVDIDCCVLFWYFEMSDCCKHGGVIIIQFRGFVLQSYNFETLTANMASMDWSFSYKIEHLFVGVRIIFNTWTHANDNSPAGIRGENQHWVVHSSELRVHCCLHFVPLVHFQSVVGNISRQIHGWITMESISIWKLRFVVLTIWFNEWVNMSHWNLHLLLYSIYKTEVTSLTNTSSHWKSLSLKQLGSFKSSNLFG